MTESMPINQTAAEQRLIEELTGSAIPPEVPDPGEPVRPGDPEPVAGETKTATPTE